MKIKHDPAQMFLPVFLPVVTALGDGTFKAELGKPKYWLSAKELAAQLFVNQDTVYRWREEGIIPMQLAADGNGKLEDMVLPSGRRGYKFSSALVPLLRKQFMEHK